MQRRRVAPVHLLALAAMGAAIALLLAGPGGLRRAPSEPPVTIVYDDGLRTTFENRDGRWTIYKRCLGPAARTRLGLRWRRHTVGPGYVARVVRFDGVRVVDDEHGAGGLNAPGNGGLGGFGFHLARGHAPFELGLRNAWNVDGRTCAPDNRGFGVLTASVVQPPSVDAAGGHMAVDVWLRDAWGRTGHGPDVTRDGVGDALARVRYRYEVGPSDVRALITVTTYCDTGCARGPGPAYLKEPKLVAAVNDSPYPDISVRTDSGALATDARPTTEGCFWRYAAPDPTRVTQTNQCYADDRARSRFDYDPHAADAECATCLNVVMRAYAPAERATSPWENAASEPCTGAGLDSMACAAGERESANDRDRGCLRGCLSIAWHCGGGVFTDASRTWELVGGAKRGGYVGASVLHNGWAGGNGAYDCEPLSRRMVSETYSVFASYSVGPGWRLG